MLYLLKSATTKQFLQENLNILASPMDSTATTGYSPRWVPTDLWENIEVGTEICWVFSDSPYKKFFPIRRGKIIESINEAGELTIRTTLKNFVSEINLDEFSQRILKLRGENNYFVIQDPSPELTFESNNEFDPDNWVSIIDELVKPLNKWNESKYKKSTFLFQSNVIDQNGEPLLNQEELIIGEKYFQKLFVYTPNADTFDENEYQLIVKSESASLQTQEKNDLPNRGFVEFPLIPQDQNRSIDVNAWVKPNRASSTSLLINFYTKIPEGRQISEPVTPTDQTLSLLNDNQIREIIRVICAENENSRDRDLIQLIDQVLIPVSTETNYLLEQKGRAFFRLRNWNEAYKVFTETDPDILSPETVSCWFISACKTKMNTDYKGIISHFNAWRQTELVENMIEALPDAPSSQRLLLLEEVWLTSGYHRKVWEKLRNSFSNNQDFFYALELMVDENLFNLLSPIEGYEQLYARFSNPGEVPLEFLEKLIDWGVTDPSQAKNLDELLIELVRRQTNNNIDPEIIWKSVDDARNHTPPRVWVNASEQFAEYLTGSDDEQWRKLACQQFIELARIYRENLQDIDQAGEYLSKAALLIGNDHTLTEEFEKEQEVWEMALQKLEPIQKWLATLSEVKIEKLRTMTAGKRALFVGGRNKGFDQEEIRREFSFEEAEFVPHFASERGSLDKVKDKISGGKLDYLFDFIRFGAHRNLEGDCVSHGVEYIKVQNSRSLQQITRALAQKHQINLE